MKCAFAVPTWWFSSSTYIVCTLVLIKNSSIKKASKTCKDWTSPSNAGFTSWNIMNIPQARIQTQSLTTVHRRSKACHLRREFGCWRRVILEIQTSLSQTLDRFFRVCLEEFGWDFKYDPRSDGMHSHFQVNFGSLGSWHSAPQCVPVRQQYSILWNAFQCSEYICDSKGS